MSGPTAESIEDALVIRSILDSMVRAELVRFPPKESIERNPDGTLDDVAITDVAMFRLEQMDTGHWWMALYMPDGTTHRFHLTSTRRINAFYEKEPAT